ncbi:MAG: D-arabinono-1,4-lactone oxidase [Solirubrobacterales bacterium]
MADTDDDGPIWRNWAREQSCRPTVIRRPRTREGLVREILAARERDDRLKVAGSGHSFTGAALTGGTMLRIEALDRVLGFDPATGRVKVEAGAVLGDLSRELDRLGVAFANLGDIDHQTLAGSISTATHGTGERFRNVSAQVAGIELITADGATHHLSAEADRESFDAARVGVGALGVIYAVTLETVPAYRISRVDRALPLSEVIGDLDRRVAAHDHFEFYVFPHTGKAVCRESTRTDEPARPPHPAKSFAREVVLENWVGAGAVALARALPSAIPKLGELAVAGVDSERKLDKSYEVFASDRRIRFTEMEYAVPRERAVEAIERAVEIAEKASHRVAFPIEVRFVAADDAYLSPSYQRDACYIAVHQDRKLDWPSYFAEVEAVFEALDGRPHWGKRHTLTRAQLAERYPRWEEFQSVRRRLDPDGAFSNDYTDTVLGPVG